MRVSTVPPDWPSSSPFRPPAVSAVAGIRFQLASLRIATTFQPRTLSLAPATSTAHLQTRHCYVTAISWLHQQTFNLALPFDMQSLGLSARLRNGLPCRLNGGSSRSQLQQVRRLALDVHLTAQLLSLQLTARLLFIGGGFVRGRSFDRTESETTELQHIKSRTILLY